MGKDFINEIIGYIDAKTTGLELDFLQFIKRTLGKVEETDKKVDAIKNTDIPKIKEEIKNKETTIIKKIDKLEQSVGKQKNVLGGDIENTNTNLLKKIDGYSESIREEVNETKKEILDRVNKDKEIITETTEKAKKTTKESIAQVQNDLLKKINKLSDTMQSLEKKGTAQDLVKKTNSEIEKMKKQLSKFDTREEVDNIVISIKEYVDKKIEDVENEIYKQSKKNKGATVNTMVKPLTPDVRTMKILELLAIGETTITRNAGGQITYMEWVNGTTLTNTYNGDGTISSMVYNFTDGSTCTYTVTYTGGYSDPVIPVWS